MLLNVLSSSDSQLRLYKDIKNHLLLRKEFVVLYYILVYSRAQQTHSRISFI